VGEEESTDAVGAMVEAVQGEMAAGLGVGLLVGGHMAEAGLVGRISVFLLLSSSSAWLADAHLGPVLSTATAIVPCNVAPWRQNSLWICQIRPFSSSLYSWRGRVRGVWASVGSSC